MLRELKKRLVLQVLNHVPFDGWTEKALAAAAKDIGIDRAVAKNAFPGLGKELISFHSHLADEMMLADFASMDMAPRGITAKVETMIRLRLERWQPYKETIRCAAGVLLAPENSLLTTKLLYQTADGIWRALGDRSADFNFYTKRATLAGIYGATLLYWFDDQSEGQAATWHFLGRQLANIGRIPSMKANIFRWRSKLPNPMKIYRRIKKRNPTPLTHG